MVDPVPLVQVNRLGDDVLHCNYTSVMYGRGSKVEVLTIEPWFRKADLEMNC